MSEEGPDSGGYVGLDDLCEEDADIAKPAQEAHEPCLLAPPGVRPVRGTPGGSVRPSSWGRCLAPPPMPGTSGQLCPTPPQAPPVPDASETQQVVRAAVAASGDAPVHKKLKVKNQQEPVTPPADPETSEQPPATLVAPASPPLCPPWHLRSHRPPCGHSGSWVRLEYDMWSWCADCSSWVQPRGLVEFCPQCTAPEGRQWFSRFIASPKWRRCFECSSATGVVQTNDGSLQLPNGKPVATNLQPLERFRPHMFVNGRDGTPLFVNLW